MLLDAALYPDKPVTELDGYSEYLMQFKSGGKAVIPATKLTEATAADEVATGEEEAVAGDAVVQQ